MKKSLIVLSACLAFSLSAFSQKQKKQGNTPASWSEKIAVAKQNAYEQMKKNSLPVSSKVIKAKQAAEKFTADVTGLDEMVLYTWEYGRRNCRRPGCMGKCPIDRDRRLFRLAERSERYF